MNRYLVQMVPEFCEVEAWVITTTAQHPRPGDEFRCPGLVLQVIEELPPMETPVVEARIAGLRRFYCRKKVPKVPQ